MELTQHSKLLAGIPAVDIVVTMGCNVACPYLPCKRREDWGLDDPTGFRHISIQLLKRRLIALNPDKYTKSTQKKAIDYICNTAKTSKVILDIWYMM